MHTSAIAVVIPAYNAGRFVNEAIESVLAQTTSQWECVIWAVLYATTMVCSWTLLRIVGSWTRNCAWIARRRGRLQRIAEKVLFPKDCNACHR